MPADVQQLKDKVNSLKEISEEKIDTMIQLAEMLNAENNSEAKELAQQIVKLSKSIAYDKGEAAGWINAGVYAVSQRNFQEATPAYQRAIKIYNALNDNDGLANAYSKLGNVGLYDGKYEDALDHYNMAILLRKQLGDEQGMADLFTNSAIIFGLQGSYAQALQSHLKALKIYERLNVPHRVAASTSNIGVIYLEQQNFDEALKMFERALALREERGEIKEVGVQLNNIGYVLQEQKKLDESLSYHLRALKLREEIGDKAKLAATYSNLGTVYKAKGENAKALDYYVKSLVIFREMNEKRGLVQSYNNLGELYFETDKLEEAHSYLKKSIQLADEMGLKNQLRKALEFSAQVYAREGKFEDAYNTQIRFMNLDKEIASAEISLQMAQLTANHEIEQKEREAEMHRIKNAELTKAYNELDEAKKRSEELLLNILPEEVSEELKQSGKTKARSYESVTVLFADIKGFTRISEQFTAEEIVSGIDEYFEEFDKLMDKHGVEKIKTIGDAYLCVCGVPVPDADHAVKMVRVAFDFIDTVLRLKEKRTAEGKHSFDFRVGIHSGPIVAGVVGIRKFAYDIWGDTVNTASRMQSNSEPNRINISETTYQLVKDKFFCEYRGEIEAKNKGKLKMYFVEK